MQPYRWSCFACGAGNAPESLDCAQCGFAAKASGSAIEQARKAAEHGSETKRTSAAAEIEEGAELPQHVSRRAEATASRRSASPSPAGRLALFAFGVVCTIGGISSFASGKWPAYMAPQLDVIAVPLSWFSERLGAYVAGAVALAVGILSLAVAFRNSEGE